MIFVDTGTGRVPIELAGTGVLQAVQILGYVHYFHPSAIILDEPDSHLHPNNQRLLCKLLQGVAEERDTQVFLTTHSRHVVDALSGQATFLWVRNRAVEKMDQDHDLAILLDIGALDVKEMLSQSHAKCIVLTEDALKRGLEALLSASGIPMDDTLTLAYYGCTSPHNLRPLLELIRASNPQAKIVVHRDRDYLTDQEGTEWETKIRSMEAEPFLTLGVDIESHFLRADHLAELNGKTEAEMDQLLRRATEECRELSIEKYVNGRTDIAKKAGTFRALNLGQMATSAPQLVDGNAERYRHAKTVLKKARQLYQQDPRLRTHNQKSMVAARQMALKKVWGAAVVAGGDAPPVLEAAEHAFNAVPVLVQFWIIGNRFLAVGAARDAGSDGPGASGRPGTGHCRSPYRPGASSPAVALAAGAPPPACR